MRNCQFSFQKMTARCEASFPFKLFLSHQRFPYHRPIPQARLAITPLFAAPILSRNYFCNTMPSVFQMKSCNFAPAKHIYPIKCKHSTLFFLLLLSNVFMTFAWYGHLKLQQTGTSSHWPLIAVILFSWGIALFEYCCQVPANRIGFVDNGGPFSLIQLKVIQEVVSLIVFTIIVTTLFRGESLHWNHMVAFCCLVAAVYFVFK